MARIWFTPARVEPGADVSDADALVTDVKDPKTFYSVAAPRKTGTMPTVAIVAANDNYPAGYHAGNVGGLDAIDAELAAANINKGITIFGKVGTLVSLQYALDQGWFAGATVAEFQANAGTGTAGTPGNINDNNTASYAIADIVGEYVEVDFGHAVLIRQWRQFPHDAMNGTGRFTIQYFDLFSETWVDWITGEPMRGAAGWSGFTIETIELTTKIRIITTTLDLGGDPDSNIWGEFEVIY